MFPWPMSIETRTENKRQWIGSRMEGKECTSISRTGEIRIAIGFCHFQFQIGK